MLNMQILILQIIDGITSSDQDNQHHHKYNAIITNIYQKDPSARTPPKLKVNSRLVSLALEKHINNMQILFEEGTHIFAMHSQISSLTRIFLFMISKSMFVNCTREMLTIENWC